MTRGTFRIITLGCKVNQYESAYLEESLAGAGWSRVLRGQGAELTVANTCIVTQRAAYQSRQAIRKALRENPAGVVAAVGCYAQVFPRELARIPGLHLVLGNTAKAKVAEVAADLGREARPLVLCEDFGPETPFEWLPVRRFSDRTRAFLKIQDGCRSFCSYCVVPFARGPLRSLEPAGVIRMLASLAEEGYREVVLTGINLGKYGRERDGRQGLADLLRLIGRAALPLRVRLSSIEPGEIDDSLIQMVGSEDWLCRHFHVPLQSGDDAVLKRMNRPYTGRQFAALVERIRGRIPLAAIGVDVMAGFPGEDEEAFEMTRDLIARAPISYLHVFPFSPREGTAAARFSGRVHPQTAKRRAAELRRLGQEKRSGLHAACLGEDLPVLVEGRAPGERGMLKGLSDNYVPVTFPWDRPLRNAVISVRAEALTDKGVRGRPRSLSF